MSDTRIDPYHLLGSPETWGAFGEGEEDAAIDAERRAMCDYFLRRLHKAQRRHLPDGSSNILCGGTVALAGLFIASSGGANALPQDAFERWIAVCTFAWHQALEISSPEAGHG